MTGRKQQGGEVDSKDIKKHRNDVFRLSQLLTAAEPVFVAGSVHADLRRFLDGFPEDSPEWPGILQAIGIKRKNFATQTLTVLRNGFIASE